jgi:crotonobetainyl-CoA:carnitine CoA-transferase CaiB-like acyl-CoA transferase
VPIAPVNTPKTIAQDPQFRDRFPLYPVSQLDAEELPFPLKVADVEMPAPTKAPEVGEHTDEVLTEVLGYDPDRVAELRKSGALG